MKLLALLPLLLLPADPVALGELAQARLDLVAPRVARICGAEFEDPPRVLLVTSEEAATAFAEDLRPQVTMLYPGASAGQVRTLLGLAARSSAASAMARYSPSRKAVLLLPAGFELQRKLLGLSPEDSGPLLAHVLAHEAVHALDDQRFDLRAFFGGARDREALRARTMVVEGRAAAFGGVVAAELGAPDHVRSISPGGTEPDGIRDHLFRLLYAAGEQFVTRLRAAGGLEAADGVMRHPPTLTHYLFHPERWPDGAMDPRPAELLRKAYPDSPVQALSELELRARYAALDSPAAAGELFAGFRGGAQALVEDTNAAVLAFADEAAAMRFVERSRKEVPADRDGTLVVRAAGDSREVVLARLREMLRR